METQNQNAQGKTIIITGSNSGIGKAAAQQLAARGATVVMVCRNQTAGETARREIVAQTGNTNVELFVCDVSEQNSIRAFVQNFTRKYERLDALINNAANFDQTMKQPRLTSDGIETIFATNHLGPFLMTNLLLEALKAGAPARVLNVASKGLMTFPFLDIEFDNLNGQKKFSVTHAYYLSKLAQVMFTYDLAERLQGTGITVNCSRVTNVQLEWARISAIPAYMRWAYTIKRKFSITPEQMAASYVQLTLAPEFENVTGTYFDEHNRAVKSSAKSYNRAAWKKLWDVSAQLTHLTASDAPAAAAYPQTAIAAPV
jgi:NAD(P)-dependent dehydrogenase (short-subunit alcohol dehydrogenase family)